MELRPFQGSSALASIETTSKTLIGRDVSTSGGGYRVQAGTSGSGGTISSGAMTANRQEIELPPKGTHGVEMPKLAGLLVKSMSFMGDVMFRLGIKVQGRPLLRLETVGARTGKSRSCVLGWFPDDERRDARIVVASNAGSARHPGWAYNLAANPDKARVDLGDEDMQVDVELLSGVERAAMWGQVVEMAPGYGRYEEKTDREMPLFRLIDRVSD